MEPAGCKMFFSMTNPFTPLADIPLISLDGIIAQHMSGKIKMDHKSWISSFSTSSFK